MRRFNVTGVCVPKKHYMADTSGKLSIIKEMIDRGDYFTINRARQFGKTTTLFLLRQLLKNDYTVVSMSFEGLGDESFSSAAAFCGMFMGMLAKALPDICVSEKQNEYWTSTDEMNFVVLSRNITQLCVDKKIVLMIDEVDKISDNRVYLHFLGMLRDKYLKCEMDEDYTFHSVILAGVHDIRNIKLKLMNEGIYTSAAAEGKLLNSPWNIAVNFNVDMSFNPAEISTMLSEYEKDHNTGMDIMAVAEEIHSYSGGYPFLVSRICQCIDEELGKDWTLSNIKEAVSKMFYEKNTLFDDMFKNIEGNKNLHDFLYELLIVGEEMEFTPYNPVIDLGNMFGFLKRNERNKAVVANRIFEILIYDYFISKDKTSGRRIKGVLRQDVADDENFNMELCLQKFAQHYKALYNEIDEQFIEREGRLMFLSYLKPLINGTGFYYIETQLADRRRIDIVVSYGHKEFIIELKLWKGEAAHEKAYEQLSGYLEGMGTDTGYLLTFDFRKDENKHPRAEWVEYETPDGRHNKIFDVVV